MSKIDLRIAALLLVVAGWGIMVDAAGEGRHLRSFIQLAAGLSFGLAGVFFLVRSRRGRHD